MVFLGYPARSNRVYRYNRSVRWARRRHSGPLSRVGGARL